MPSSPGRRLSLLGGALVLLIAAMAGLVALVAGTERQLGRPRAAVHTHPRPRPFADLDVPPQARLFAAGSVWNTAVPADAALDAASGRLISALAGEAAREYRLGVGPWIATSKGSTPIYQVSGQEPAVTVRLDDPALPWRASLQAAFEAVPIPADADPAAGPDQQMVIWQPSTDKMWEFFHMRRQAGEWHAAWGGAVQHVSQSPGYYGSSSWPGALPQWGATATSLPVAAGVITLADLQSGQIDHALAIDLPNTRAGVWAWPAQRSDGTGGQDSIPEGAHLRLDPRLDLAALHLPTLTMMMAEAAQKYGIIVRDRTGKGISFYVQDPRSTGGNPFYTKGTPTTDGPFQGQWPTQLMRAFPWSHLQLLRMQLCSNTPCLR